MYASELGYCISVIPRLERTQKWQGWLCAVKLRYTNVVDQSWKYITHDQLRRFHTCTYNTVAVSAAIVVTSSPGAVVGAKLHLNWRVSVHPRSERQ